MRALDQSISWAIVVDVFVAIVVIMIQIYALAQNSPILRQYATIIAFNAVSEITRFIINCLVNGLVYDQTDKIMAILDFFTTTDFDEQMFRELIAFKTMCREISCGFTIGGLAPLRKTTLLAVCTN